MSETLESNTENNVCIWTQKEAQKGIMYYKTCSGNAPNTLNHLKKCYICKREIKFINMKNYKKITHGDRIRTMNNEELAEFLLKVNLAYAEPCMLGVENCKFEGKENTSCKQCFLEYLKTEVMQEVN